MHLGNRRAGGILAGLLIGLLALVVLLVAGSIVLGLFIAHNVRVEEVSSGRGKVVRVETPVGSMRVREHSGANSRHLGLPIYPGAVATSDKGKMVDFEVKLGDNQRGFDVVAADYTTADPVEKVTAFYRNELPHWILSARDGHVEMRYSEDGYKRVVAIREKGGLTRISLVQIGEPQEN